MMITCLVRVDDQHSREGGGGEGDGGDGEGGGGDGEGGGEGGG